MAEVSIVSPVRINDDVLFQELQGEAVLLNLKTGVYFGLDSVGTRIWQLLGEHQVLSEVVGAMVREYDVTEECCATDVMSLVTRMADHGLVAVGDREPK
jgi:hypothetical protein